MNKQREALQMALEALEDYQANGAPFLKCDAAVAAIREALAEQKQEPVAWMHQPTGMPRIYSIEPIPGPDSIPLYTAPPARKPLTDEDISTIVQSMSAYTWDAHILARRIEKAHGITE